MFALSSPAPVRPFNDHTAGPKRLTLSRVSLQRPCVHQYNLSTGQALPLPPLSQQSMKLFPPSARGHVLALHKALLNLPQPPARPLSNNKPGAFLTLIPPIPYPAVDATPSTWYGHASCTTLRTLHSTLHHGPAPLREGPSFGCRKESYYAGNAHKVTATKYLGSLSRLRRPHQLLDPIRQRHQM